MANEEIKQRYLGLDVGVLSAEFFRTEGPSARGNAFSEVWTAVGLQFLKKPQHSFAEILALLGNPDLGAGTVVLGHIGWLLHSPLSDGAKYDWICGYDIRNCVIDGLWGNSTEPECSPANVLPRFDKQAFMRSQQATERDAQRRVR